MRATHRHPAERAVTGGAGIGRRRRRALLPYLAAVFGAGGGVLAACAAPGQPGQGGGPPAGRTVAPVTVRVMDRTGSEEEVYPLRVPPFQEANPGITVAYELSPEWGAPKITALAAGGGLPDLGHVLVNTQDYHAFLLQGVLVPVDELVRRDRLDLRQYYAEAVRSLQVDGRLGGLPYRGYMARIALMYNAELLKQAGLAAPGPAWTYDDLATMLPRLTRGAGEGEAAAGLGIGWSELTTMIAVFRAWGGDVFSADGKRATLTAPAVGAALRWHLDRALRERSLLLGVGSANPQRSFSEGKLALWGRNNPGTAGNLVPLRDQLNWGMTLMPRGPGGRRGGMLQSSAMAMTRDSRLRDQAWRLQQWLTDRETGVQFALASKGSLTPGARPDVYADPRFLGRPDLPPGVQETARRAMDEPEPFGLAWNFRGNEVDRLLREVMDRLAGGEQAPEAGLLQDLERRIQAVLDQPRAGT